MVPSVRRHLVRTSALWLMGISLCLAGCSGSPNHNDAARGGTGAKRSAFAFVVDGHGTADISWSGSAGRAVPHATLPWHATVRQSAGGDPVTLTVVLDGHSSQATCSITVDGRRVSSSLAQGRFGRATCHTPSGSAVPSDG